MQKNLDEDILKLVDEVLLGTIKKSLEIYFHESSVEADIPKQINSLKTSIAMAIRSRNELLKSLAPKQ